MFIQFRYVVQKDGLIVVETPLKWSALLAGLILSKTKSFYGVAVYDLKAKAFLFDSFPPCVKPVF